MKKVNIVMTGGTSGLGEVAAKKLASTPNYRVILGFRKNKIAQADHIPLNLLDLQSVREFAHNVISVLNQERINVLICNAGTNFANIHQRTKDGFEATFGINHLAHFLLIHLLKPHFDQDVKVILTTSGTHNPAEGSRAAPPTHANVQWLAHPELDKTLDTSDKVNAQRAYSSSKLCNLLTARHINSLAEAKVHNWKGIAYDPGPTPGTGLAKNLGPFLRIMWKIFQNPTLRKRAFPKSNSIEDAGMALADLTTGKIQLPDNKEYAALRAGKMTYPEPSDLAMNNEIMKAVWMESLAILEIKEDEA